MANDTGHSSNTNRWLKNGGSISAKSDLDGKIRVFIADAGGSAPGWNTEVESLEEGLIWFEKKTAEIIRSNEIEVEKYISGELEAPVEKVLRVPGIGKVDLAGSGVGGKSGPK